MSPRKFLHLDVASPHLAYLSNVDSTLNWRKLKDVIAKAAGKVVFVETFDAWFDKRIEHAVIQFDDAEAQAKFMRLPNDWFETHFKGLPKIEILQGDQDRYKFFNRIFTVTGINLLEQGGKPPLSWVERVKSKHEERRNKRQSKRPRSASPAPRQSKRNRSASPAPRQSRGQARGKPSVNNRRGGYRPYEPRRNQLTDASLRAMPRDVLYSNQARRAPAGVARPQPWDLGPSGADSWAVDPMLGMMGQQPYNLRPRYNMAPLGMGMQTQPMGMQYQLPSGYGAMAGLPHYNTL